MSETFDSLNRLLKQKDRLLKNKDLNVKNLRNKLDGEKKKKKGGSSGWGAYINCKKKLERFLGGDIEKEPQRKDKKSRALEVEVEKKEAQVRDLEGKLKDTKKQMDDIKKDIDNQNKENRKNLEKTTQLIKNLMGKEQEEQDRIAKSKKSIKEEQEKKQKKEKEKKQKKQEEREKEAIMKETEKYNREEKEEKEREEKERQKQKQKKEKQTEEGNYDREDLIKWSKINKNIKIPPKVKDLKDVDEEIKFYADVMNNNVFGRSIFETEYDIDPLKIQNAGYKYKNVKLKTNLLEFENKTPTAGSIGWYKQTKTIIGGRDFINNSKAKERVKLVELAKKEIKNMKQNEEDLEKYKDILKNNQFYQQPSVISDRQRVNNKIYVKNPRVKDGVLLFDRITDDDIGFEVVEEGGKWKWKKEKHILKSGRDAKERKEKPKKEEMKQDKKELEKFMEIVEKYELKDKISKTKMPSDKLFIKNVNFEEGEMFNTLTYEYITASQAKTNKPFKKETVSKSTAPVIKRSFRKK